MSKLKDSINTSADNRIKLIYEFNENSPLFARVASILLESDNINEAIKILEKGLLYYPSYPSAHFVLALAYAFAGKEEDALKSAITGSEILGSSGSLKYYENKIAEIISERNKLSEASRPGFISEEKVSTKGDDSDILEDKLDVLAERLRKAKIIPKEEDGQPVENPESEMPVKKIVSDTMAEIFLSQKNYTEAIDIYTELLKQKPGRAGVYLQKISDINSLME
ncbi:MAG: hypothetical protein CVV24_11390 [Ignavibacteriae bacterium HGW-Ignavibacteriae-3]|nr:MAG: hypothetical protein CVV24_11390 [Ignavibacteriae bacterium HGW-Ignavibacteriae-3]